MNLAYFFSGAFLFDFLRQLYYRNKALKKLNSSMWYLCTNYYHILVLDYGKIESIKNEADDLKNALGILRKHYWEIKGRKG